MKILILLSILLIGILSVAYAENPEHYEIEWPAYNHARVTIQFEKRGTSQVGTMECPQETPKKGFRARLTILASGSNKFQIVDIQTQKSASFADEFNYRRGIGNFCIKGLP